MKIHSKQFYKNLGVALMALPASALLFHFFYVVTIYFEYSNHLGRSGLDQELLNTCVLLFVLAPFILLSLGMGLYFFTKKSAGAFNKVDLFLIVLTILIIALSSYLYFGGIYMTNFCGGPPDLIKGLFSCAH